MLFRSLKTWLAAQLVRASAKSAIAVAIRYGFNVSDGLTARFERRPQGR